MSNRVKKLYKSKENRVLSGILGGLGEYFEVDPVVLRLAWIMVSVFTGFVPGIIAYLFAALIIPKETAAH